MNTTRYIVDGVPMSPEAAQCAEAAGVDVQADVRSLLSGRMGADALLSWCLDGADADSVAGWHEYVEAVESTVEYVRAELRKAAEGHLSAIGWQPGDGLTDAALGLGEEAWGDAPAGMWPRAWTIACEAEVRRIARERQQEVQL